MSRLSSKFVSLSLGTRAARASLHSYWSMGKVLARAHHTAEPSAASPAPAGEETLQANHIAGAQAVLSELTSASGLKGVPLKVQISDALAHFDVVNGDFAESSERQLQAIATACVDDMLGNEAGPQVVRWQLQADTRHLLIASLQAATVDSLVHAASRHEMPLETLQPEFCAHWNAHAGALSGGRGVFASVTDGTVVMVLAEHGSITSLSTGAMGDAPTEALDLRADRLISSHGMDTAELTFFVLVVPEGEVLTPSPRWAVTRLPGESA